MVFHSHQKLWTVFNMSLWFFSRMYNNFIKQYKKSMRLTAWLYPSIYMYLSQSCTLQTPVSHTGNLTEAKPFCAHLPQSQLHKIIATLSQRSHPEHERQVVCSYTEWLGGTYGISTLCEVDVKVVGHVWNVHCHSFKLSRSIYTLSHDFLNSLKIR